MTVGSNFVTQGGSVTVTLNVKSSAAVTERLPLGPRRERRLADVHRPDPASANVPAGGAGVNFVWSCTLLRPGRVHLHRGRGRRRGDDDWPEASSASVLSAAGGGPNVVTWNLGSNTAAVPGEIITSGYTAGDLRLPRRRPRRPSGSTTSTPSAWTARGQRPRARVKGGALTTDGAGTIYGLRGNGTQAFWAYDIATNTWTAKANTEPTSAKAARSSS